MREELERRSMLRGFEQIEVDQDLTSVVEGLYRSGVTAVLCPSDWVAFDALSAARRLGLSVPEDISITGYDGVPPFDHEEFGLTSYKIPVDAMAAAAVKLIDDLVGNDHVDSGGLLLRGHLLVGRTAGPVPAGAAIGRA